MKAAAAVCVLVLVAAGCGGAGPTRPLPDAGALLLHRADLPAGVRFAGIGPPEETAARGKGLVAARQIRFFAPGLEGVDFACQVDVLARSDDSTAALHTLRRVFEAGGYRRLRVPITPGWSGLLAPPDQGWTYLVAWRQVNVLGLCSAAGQPGTEQRRPRRLLLAAAVAQAARVGRLYGTDQ